MVELPNLRDRVEDIPLLATDFLARLSRRYGVPMRHFDQGALTWLMARPWPGNVRELEHFVHREFLRCEGPTLSLESCRRRVSKPVVESLAFNAARASAVAEFEVRYLRRLLAATQGNVSEAARRAGKDRRVFGRLMKKYGIERGKFGGSEGNAQPE